MTLSLIEDLVLVAAIHRLLLNTDEFTEGLQISGQTTGDVASKLVESLSLGAYQPVSQIVQGAEVGILLVNLCQLILVH